MRKLTLHAKIEVTLAAALLLGSCDSAPHSFSNADYDRLDVADVNARNAIARIEELEGRLSDLESSVETNGRNISTNAENHSRLVDIMTSEDRRIADIEARLGM